MTFQPGWYLIGRDDGTVEPFYARVDANSVWACGMAYQDHILRAITAGYEGWWWEAQEIPDTVPKRFQRGTL